MNKIVVIAFLSFLDIIKKRIIENKIAQYHQYRHYNSGVRFEHTLMQNNHKKLPLFCLIILCNRLVEASKQIIFSCRVFFVGFFVEFRNTQKKNKTKAATATTTSYLIDILLHMFVDYTMTRYRSHNIPSIQAILMF